MSSTQTDALQRAVDFTKAQKVSENRYAYQAAGQWYTFGPDDVTFDSSVNWNIDQYIRMPSWWSPEQRTCLSGDPAKPVRITADLTTGEEVPA